MPSRLCLNHYKGNTGFEYAFLHFTDGEDIETSLSDKNAENKSKRYTDFAGGLSYIKFLMPCGLQCQKRCVIIVSGIR